MEDLYDEHSKLSHGLFTITDSSSLKGKHNIQRFSFPDSFLTQSAWLHRVISLTLVDWRQTISTRLLLHAAAQQNVYLTYDIKNL